ncbi:MAG: hypothetical protein IE913_07625, partial [Halothiobacillus sp.]|nr:hypothetical protein [Halothiobacillus sp.]
LNAWRIYKVLDGQWVFVAEVPKGTLEYRDTLDAPTGEALMSGEWFPPPVDLRGVSLSPGGFLTGYSGRNVHFSEQFLPHAWPPSYSLTCRYDIRGVVATANGVIIVTTGRPYIALGGTPSAMQLRDIESDYGCVSAESVVDMGEFAVYAASVGLIAIDTNGNATNLTESIINYRQWGAMSPSSIKAVRMQHLYLFKANGVWYAFDMKSGKLTTADVSDLPPTAVYDTEWGELLHLSSGKLVRTKIQATGFTWQSKPVVSQKRERFAWVQVEAESYPVQVTVTYPNPNGDLTHTHIAENGLPARLAPHMGDTFYVTVESNAAVYAVVLTNDLRELAQ